MQNNVSYDEYIRSILGYPPMNSMNNTYQNYTEQNMDYESRTNSELEGCYPEIYKIVYPMVATKCNNVRETVTNDDIENMTDEIYYALEERNENRLNINLSNDVRTSNLNNTTVSNKKPEVRASQNPENKREIRETRQINRGLRDLIKILLIRELLNRRRRPHRPPRPPMPGPGGPRPPMRPPFGPGLGRPPFNREFESLNYDIFEY